MSVEFLYGWLAEHLLLVTLFVLMLIEMFGGRAKTANALVTGVLALCTTALGYQYASGYRVTLAAGELQLDDYAVLAKLVLVACALLWNVLFSAGATIKSRFLLCSSLLGALVMMSSAGFISLFMALEMLTLPALALIVHGAGNGAAAEGALKYLLLSSVATALVLFGVAFAYGATGGLSIDAFTTSVAAGSSESLAACLLIVSGFFLKAALFPFHAWAPDAYAAARLPVTAFLASLVKGAVLLALLRIFGATVLPRGLLVVVAALAVASIAFGNLAAIRQQRFKRLLAYSSIAHAGYMAVAFLDVTGARVSDLLWYVGVYAATVIVACAALRALSVGDDDDVRVLDGAFHTRPGAAIVFGLAVLSLAGLPPLPGFFTKLFVFSSAIASGQLLVAILAFLGSFIGVTYYLSLFFRLFTADAVLAETESREGARV